MYSMLCFYGRRKNWCHSEINISIDTNSLKYPLTIKCQTTTDKTFVEIKQTAGSLTRTHGTVPNIKIIYSILHRV